jgi:opacity protein-like surface antigen
MADPLFINFGGAMKRSNLPYTILSVFLAGLAVVLFPAGAAAVPPGGYPPSFLIFKGGLYSPSDDFDIGATHFERDDGFVAELAAGHYVLPFLATELGVGYFESKASPATPPGEVKLKVIPVTLTGKVPFPIGPVEPYGEFGIGVYFVDFDGSVNTNFDKTKEVFGLHAGGGINFNITPNLFLGAEGRYLWAKPSFGGTDIKLDGFTVTGNLGIRF